MHKSTKATAIPKWVKDKVEERDQYCCIICGRPGVGNAHYIRRSQMGKGIVENVVTLCPQCHHDFDNGSMRKEYGRIIKDYLDMYYPDFTDEQRRFHKYET